MKTLRTLSLLTGTLALTAWACGQIQPHTSETLTDAGPRPPGEDVSTPPGPGIEPGAPSSPFPIRSDCTRGSRVDLSWAPVPGADRYVIEHDGRTLLEVHEPRVRMRLERSRPLTLRAMSGEQELLRWTRSGYPNMIEGDVLYLRGRRGNDTTVETLGCVTPRSFEEPVTTTLSEEWNAPVFPHAALDLRRSAALFSEHESLDPRQSQLLYVGDERVYLVTKADAFLDYSYDEPLTNPRDLDITIDPRAGVAQTATRSFVVDTKGDLIMFYAGGDWLVAEAATFAGETVRALAASNEGLWALTVGTDAAHLLYFRGASPANTPDRTIELPDFSTDASYVFDGVGLMLANTAASGHLYRLSGAAGEESWTDTEIIIEGLRSLQSSVEYTFSTDGERGAHITVRDRKTLATRGSYTLEGTEDLEIMSFVELVEYLTP